MKLLFVVASLGVGGAERHTVDLARALASRGHECAIVSMRARSADGLNVSAAERFTVSYCDAQGFLDRRAARALAARMAIVAPDVIIGVNQFALMYAHFARNLGKHVCRVATFFHTTDLHSTKDRLLNQAYKYFFARSDLLVFVCEYQARYWKGRGLHARQDAVLHNGIDAQHYMPDITGARSVTRQRYAIDESDFVIGITAAFRPEKNHVFLLRALQRLRVSGAKVKLLMVGDGPLRASLEHDAEELGIAKHAIFVGAQSDVRPFVAAFDVFTLASLKIETFSLAALEAMAMGIPAVLSDVGGAREMVQSGNNGFVYAANDMEGFLGDIHQIMKSDTARVMGQAAHQLVNERFTHDRMVDGYAKVLSSLLPTAV